MKTASLSEMLDTFRANAGTFLRDQTAQFHSLSANDQRELLFYLMANMAVSQSAQAALAQIDQVAESEKAALQ